MYVHEQSDTVQRQLTISVAEGSLTECDEGTRVRLLAFQPRTPLYRLASPSTREGAWPCPPAGTTCAHAAANRDAVFFQNNLSQTILRETQPLHAMQPQSALIDPSSLSHGQFLEASTSGNCALWASEHTHQTGSLRPPADRETGRTEIT